MKRMPLHFLLIALISMQTLAANAQDKKENPDSDSVKSPASLAFGGSFDFKNGIDDTHFFYGLKVFRPKAFGKKAGFSFGIYQTSLMGRSDSSNDRLSNTLVADARTGDFSIIGDSVKIHKAQVNGSSFNQQIKTIGGYFNLVFKLVKNNHSTLYGLVNLEYARRTLTIDKKYDLTLLDSPNIAKADFPKYTPVGSTTATSFLDEGYFGAGVLYRYKTKGIDFNISGMTGIVCSAGWRMYYAVNTSILFPKYKIEIGSAYKGLLCTENTTPYYFSFYLAKLFTIDKLLTFVTK